MNFPTKLTISRIVLTVIMIVALAVLCVIGSVNPNFVVPSLSIGEAKINIVYLVVFVVFVVASFTDYLDGHLARKNNQVTTLGKFLDPVADKLLVNSIMIVTAFSFFTPYNQDQIVYFAGWCVIICILRDIVVDALRFIAAQKGVVIGANIFGKLKTVFEMIAIMFVLLNGFPFSYFDASWPNGLQIAYFLEYAATFFSIVSGIIYVVKYRYVFTDKKVDIFKTNTKAVKCSNKVNQGENLTKDKITASDINALFREKGLTLGSVESFTGGLFASEITSVPYASHFYKGTCVTYATEEKHILLDIPYSVIDEFGVISKEVACEMAKKGLSTLNVDYCVAFTGNAGPDAMEDKPVGEVYIAVASSTCTVVNKLKITGSRHDIQTLSIQRAYEMLDELLN